jgi:hypothetical protein
MHLYAAAGIASYLIVEPGSPDDIVLRLHRLSGAHYVEEAVARGAEPLVASDPFPFRLEPHSLLGRGQDRP